MIWKPQLAFIYFSKYDTSTPGSATTYTSVNVQLLAQLVVVMQFLPGMDVSLLPSVNKSPLLFSSFLIYHDILNCNLKSFHQYTEYTLFIWQQIANVKVLVGTCILETFQEITFTFKHFIEWILWIHLHHDFKLHHYTFFDFFYYPFKKYTQSEHLFSVMPHKTLCMDLIFYELWIVFEKW